METTSQSAAEEGFDGMKLLSAACTSLRGPWYRHIATTPSRVPTAKYLRETRRTTGITTIRLMTKKMLGQYSILGPLQCHYWR